MLAAPRKKHVSNEDIRVGSIIWNLYTHRSDYASTPKDTSASFANWSFRVDMPRCLKCRAFQLSLRKEGAARGQARYIRRTNDYTMLDQTNGWLRGGW